MTATSDTEIRLQQALIQIRDWAHAYPIEAFPEIDIDAARTKLGDAQFSALHASWARHLLEGIGRIASEALLPENRVSESRTTI